jgi:hypothetical protein
LLEATRRGRLTQATRTKPSLHYGAPEAAKAFGAMSRAFDEYAAAA